MARGSLRQPQPASGTRGESPGEPGTTGNYKPAGRWTVGEGLQIRCRHLPHWQAGGAWYFVTFHSARGPLPAEARRTVMDILAHGNGERHELVAAIVMPDHVHCILHPLERAPGWWPSPRTTHSPSCPGRKSDGTDRIAGPTGIARRTCPPRPSP